MTIKAGMIVPTKAYDTKNGRTVRILQIINSNEARVRDSLEKEYIINVVFLQA